MSFLCFKLSGAEISSVKQSCPSPQPQGKVPGLRGLCFSTNPRALPAPKKPHFLFSSFQETLWNLCPSTSSKPSLHIFPLYHFWVVFLPFLPSFCHIPIVLLCCCGSPSQFYLNAKPKGVYRQDFIKTSPISWRSWSIFFSFIFSPFFVSGFCDEALQSQTNTINLQEHHHK